jgi:hypothetical protein
MISRKKNAHPDPPTRKCAEPTAGRIASWKFLANSAGLGPAGMGSVSAPAAVACMGMGRLGST